MCGIFCKLIYRSNSSPEFKDNHVNDDVFNLLSCRGPDICHFSSNYIFNGSCVCMFGATLWMQGTEPCKQPLENEFGALLFNGDVYYKAFDTSQSDTEDIFTKLLLNNSYEEDICTIKNLVGPFSLIYLNKRLNKLYFCRDKYGRKSLLLYKTKDEIIISSVLGKKYEGAFEIPANAIYCLDLTTFTFTRHLWSNGEVNIDNLNVGLELHNILEIENDHSLEYTNYEMDNEIVSMYREIETLAAEIKCRKSFLRKLLTINFFSERVEQLIKLLSESVKVRTATQPPFCKKCIKERTKCKNHCRVGLLFSGGLDCTILAALAHSHVPLDESIDLLNVAFEHKNCQDYLVPDRITSLNSLNELQRIYPERKWNLLQINITSDELKDKQIEVISDLIYPLQTILDESLGSALWFAARGKVEEDESSSRVILMGMGADELFGGYTRHRNAFKRGSWTQLGNELDLDWKRLPSRNLARDDRIVSHHGRQPRTPYLDENFLKYVLDLKPWERCFPNQCCEAGVGDKLLLRLVAMKLGLECTSVFPKRAIQFGSKIANKNENAKDISPRLKTSKKE